MAIFLLACGPCVVIVNCWDKFCSFGRAPRTKETLPDFCEWCRVTRHPRVFRGLTSFQQTPGFWGVTAWYQRGTATRQHACNDTPATRPRHSRPQAATRPRHSRPQAATRPGHGHDTMPVRSTTRRDTAGLGAVREAWAHRACNLGPLGVHPVHLTQF